MVGATLLSGFVSTITTRSQPISIACSIGMESAMLPSRKCLPSSSTGSQSMGTEHVALTIVSRRCSLLVSEKNSALPVSQQVHAYSTSMPLLKYVSKSNGNCLYGYSNAILSRLIILCTSMNCFSPKYDSDFGAFICLAVRPICRET